MTKKSLLVIEDDETIRTILAQHLRSEGFVVDEATDGKHAFSLLETIKLPDLILTDVNMPHIDGEEFIYMKNANPIFKKIPVMVISSSDRVKHLATHTVATFTKPFDVDEVIRSIHRVLD